MDQQPPPQPPPPGFSPHGWPAPRQTHNSAVVAMVLGIVSVVMCGLLTGVPAMILGRKAVREIDASNGALDGRGMAQAGFWTGLVGTVMSVLATLAFLAVTVLFVGTVAGIHEDFVETCATVVPAPTDDPFAHPGTDPFADPGDDWSDELDEAC